MERATDFTAPPGASSNGLSPAPLERARWAKLSPIGFRQGVASSCFVLAAVIQALAIPVPPLLNLTSVPLMEYFRVFP